MVTHHRAAIDPRLRAEVRSRRPLRYAEGARQALDLPAHVRAGSALAWVGARLAVVQDDVRCVALVDPVSTAVEAIALAPGADGARQFDERRGNKQLKLDLESCISYSEGTTTTLIAFGSGSSPRRETLVVLEIGAEVRVREVAAPRFFGALRATREFAGSELNLEGAALLPNGALRLFQRGNGMARDGREPLDATADLDFALLRDGIARNDVPAPRLRDIRRYDLGRCGAARITFTDAAVDGDEVLFLATAEDSPDAVSDGPVTGVFLGRIGADGGVRAMARITDSNGAPFLDKAEGLALDPDAHGSAYLVLDRDDPAIASDLCTLRFTI
jgi:hypothetical protein